MTTNNYPCLQEWLKFSTESERGAIISPLLDVIDDELFGRGIQTNDDIARGTVIIRISKPFLLNYTTVLKFFSFWNAEVNQFLSKYICNFDKTMFKTPEDKITKIYENISFEKLIKLTSHQLLSMFLLLEKKRNNNSWWKPFFDCLPVYQDYDSIPMTWKFNGNVHDEDLLNFFPKSTRLHIQKQIDQFNLDFSIIASLIVPFENIISKKEYLWAWITVNTRCLYFELPKYLPYNLSNYSSLNQITLVPYVDYINHSSDLCNAQARCTKNGYEVITTTNVKKGDYIWFFYGPHNDSFLQCEYGFSLSNAHIEDNKMLKLNQYNSIDITEIIEKLLRIPKKENVLRWLKQSGYYGDYTIGFETADRSDDVGLCIVSKPSHRTRIALAALIEKEDGFTFNEKQNSLMCPSKLEKFFQGYTDGEYYLKTEMTLLLKMLAKYKHDLNLKIEAINILQSNSKSIVVKNILLSELYLVEHL